MSPVEFTAVTAPAHRSADRCTCKFDWGHPLSAEDNEALAAKKKELGTSCMKDFNFHTAHLMHTLTRVLIKQLGASGEKAVTLALAEYVDTFGQEYLDVLDTISLDEIYPFEM